MSKRECVFFVLYVTNVGKVKTARQSHTTQGFTTLSNELNEEASTKLNLRRTPDNEVLRNTNWGLRVTPRIPPIANVFCKS